MVLSVMQRPDKKPPQTQKPIRRRRVYIPVRRHLLKQHSAHTPERTKLTSLDVITTFTSRGGMFVSSSAYTPTHMRVTKPSVTSEVSLWISSCAVTVREECLQHSWLAASRRRFAGNKLLRNKCCVSRSKRLFWTRPTSYKTIKRLFY